MSHQGKLKAYRADVARRLRFARIQSGVGSQAEVAKLLTAQLCEPIEPSRIGNYEQGTRLPDPLVLQAMCRIYKVWPAWVSGFAEAPLTPEESALLDRYRATDERGRKAIVLVAEAQPRYEQPSRPPFPDVPPELPPE